MKGFTSVMPWLAVTENNIAEFYRQECIKISKVELIEVVLIGNRVIFVVNLRFYIYLYTDQAKYSSF